MFTTCSHVDENEYYEASGFNSVPGNRNGAMFAYFEYVERSCISCANYDVDQSYVDDGYDTDDQSLLTSGDVR